MGHKSRCINLSLSRGEQTPENAPESLIYFRAKPNATRRTLKSVSIKKAEATKSQNGFSHWNSALNLTPSRVRHFCLLGLVWDRGESGALRHVRGLRILSPAGSDIRSWSFLLRSLRRNTEIISLKRVTFIIFLLPHARA